MENKQKYPCIETTLDFETDNLIVRLWIDNTYVTKTVEDKSNLEIISFLRGALCGILHKDDMYDLLIENLSKNIPNINAIQIKEKAKDGISWGTVVYTVDFSEDVHG